MINAGWSQDLQSYQVEVPVPKFIMTAPDTGGEPWTYNGFEGTEKGTMWITVATRFTAAETPRLLFEKAKIDTLGWNYTGYHDLDYYAPGDDHRRVVSVAALIARFGHITLVTEEDNESFLRGTAGSSSGEACEAPGWLKERLQSRLAIKATSHAFSEENVFTVQDVGSLRVSIFGTLDLR